MKKNKNISVFQRLQARCGVWWTGLRGKMLFRDKFGLQYYLWPDTRVWDTIVQGVRSDDEGVIRVIERLCAMVKSQTAMPLTAIDVGAYIGVISLVLARAFGQGGRVYSFEPYPYNFKCLLENISLNKKKGALITACPFAVKDRVEHVLLHIDVVDPSSSSLVSAVVAGGKSDSSVLVETIRLEAFCQDKGVEKLFLLKVDAESQDYEVLLGAGALLKEGRIDYIIVEYLSDAELDKVKSLLESAGYTMYFIIRHGNGIVRDMKDYPYEAYKKPLNLLFISANASVKGNLLGSLKG